MNILIGLIIIAVGLLIVLKSEWLLQNFGRMDFFEKHLGSSGGSRLGYKLTGMLAIFFGILIMTNMIGGFLEWALSPLIRSSQNK
ncbi:MAG: hypothetical protein Q7T79_01135 [bacterium]|nr:hypothetical protein [bacterium]